MTKVLTSNENMSFLLNYVISLQKKIKTEDGAKINVLEKCTDKSK